MRAASASCHKGKQHDLLWQACPYTSSAHRYEQTNARASHILVKAEEDALKIRSDIEAGKLDFSEAAMRFSTCNSASQGEARSARSLAHACCSLLASMLKRGIARWSTCVRIVPDLSVTLPDIPVSFRRSARQVHPGADGAGV